MVTVLRGEQLTVGQRMEYHLVEETHHCTGVPVYALFDLETLHIHLPGEFLLRSKIAQLSMNINQLQRLKITLLNLPSRSQVDGYGLS